MVAENRALESGESKCRTQILVWSLHEVKYGQGLSASDMWGLDHELADGSNERNPTMKVLACGLPSFRLVAGKSGL